MFNLRETREAITDAGHRVSAGLVAVAVIALVAVAVAAFTLGVVVCRLS